MPATQCRRLRRVDREDGVSFRCTRTRSRIREYCHSTKTITAIAETATRNINIALLLCRYCFGDQALHHPRPATALPGKILHPAQASSSEPANSAQL